MSGGQVLRSFGRTFRVLGSAGALVVAAAGAGGACERPGAAEPTFPIRPSIGASFLQDASGAPFFLNGDTAWSLIGDLTREDADIYLRDRQSRGFNTLLVSLIEHRFSTNAPANAYGDQPFSGERGFASPNPAYFEHAGWVLQRACELGFLVLLTPAYAGAGGGPEGWYADMVAAGPDRLRDYGRWLGAQLGRFDNIVWVQGGDYDPPAKDLVRALVDGINETDSNAVHTSHGAPDTRPLDYWAGQPWLAINNVYTYGEVWKAAAEEARRSGDRPFFLIESAYENEHEAGAFRVRLQAYQAILSGASGHVYGNNPIWHFDGPGLFPAPGSWKKQLGSPGAQSMSVLNDIITSREWWRLEPDIDGAFLIWGRGSRGMSRAVAALADDGSFGFVYVPSERRVVLELGRLGGSRLFAEWRDPSTGETFEIAGSPFRAERQSFLPPGRNASGDDDWVLVLTTALDAAEASR